MSTKWDEAQEFINKLNAKNDGYTYRLPGEAEWEYACRAGSAWVNNEGEQKYRVVRGGDYNGNMPGVRSYYRGSSPPTSSRGLPVVAVAR